MEIEEITQLARAIRLESNISSWEHGLILQEYSQLQNEANLFPVNEIEEQRLFKMARDMFYIGRAYERLYSYENNLTQ